jgi:glycosyltransferase involved in cell wall biosynthesis
MKFSVIIPCKDSGKTINRAIDSILSQSNTQNEFEIVVVQSGPADTTKSFLSRDDRILVVTPDHETGISEARNAGLEHSSGEIIGFLDSDDFYEPGVFETVRSAFLSLPTADAVIGEIRTVEKGKEYLISDKYHQGTSLDTAENKDAFCSSPYLWWQVGAFFIRKSLFAALNLRFDISLKYNEDLPFLASVVAKSKAIALIDKVTVDYVYNSEGNHTKKTSKSFIDGATSIRMVIDQFTDNGLAASRQHWSDYLVREMLPACSYCDPKERKEIARSFHTLHLLKGIHPHDSKGLGFLFKTFGYGTTWAFYRFYKKRIKRQKS